MCSSQSRTLVPCIIFGCWGDFYKNEPVSHSKSIFVISLSDSRWVVLSLWAHICLAKMFLISKMVHLQLIPLNTNVPLELYSISHPCVWIWPTWPIIYQNSCIPLQLNQAATKWLLHYLKATLHHGLFLKCSSPLNLHIFSIVDWLQIMMTELLLQLTFSILELIWFHVAPRSNILLLDLPKLKTE